MLTCSALMPRFARERRISISRYRDLGHCRRSSEVVKKWGAAERLAHNWTVKGEYLYIVGAGTGVSKDQLNLVRLGVNMKF